jgi:hypothetical protein
MANSVLSAYGPQSLRHRSSGGSTLDLLHASWPAVFLILAALALRAWQFGNPVVDYDEQLYLLIGDGMLHGKLPYVDMWDRKPFGLFSIYALIRLLGGNGIIQYQVIAALFAGATASLIWAMARRATANIPAICAGLCYILWLNMYHGSGGQTPIFYNLFTAIAAWCAFRANDASNRGSIILLGSLAMLMSGLAIQVKYVPVVEGIFFGNYFLWLLHRNGLYGFRIFLVSGMYVGLATAPTLLSVCYYAMIGELRPYIYANFISIFDRLHLPPYMLHWYQRYIFITALPALLIVPFALHRRWKLRDHDLDRDFWFLVGWISSATIGFLIVGNFYDNYFLPVLLPLFVIIAPIFGKKIPEFAATVALIVWALSVAPLDFAAARADTKAAYALANAVKPYVSNKCLYVYDGPSIIYLMAHACAPTRYLYPDHLTNPVEAPALGVDASTEESRLLATRPGAIITADAPLADLNEATQRLVQQTIARDYVTVARIGLTGRIYYVHALRELHPGPSPIHDPQAANPA